MICQLQFLQSGKLEFMNVLRFINRLTVLKYTFCIEVKNYDSISKENLIAAFSHKENGCYLYIDDNFIFVLFNHNNISRIVNLFLEIDSDFASKITPIINGNYSTSHKYGSQELIYGRNPYLMGILNVTPDSFSDGGVYNNTDAIYTRINDMLVKGVSILDIGGESSRPGSEPVSDEEEINRISSPIKISKSFSELIVSVDTYKSLVAEYALKNGAHIVNDISGGVFDSKIFDVVANYDAGLILMHTTALPKVMQQEIKYNNLFSDIYEYLYHQCNKAVAKNISKIIIDPGIGFGKTVEQNLAILSRVSDFKSLGFPILIGLSRKSFLGSLLSLEVGERDFATSLAEMISLMNGADIIRTHNLDNAKQVLSLFNNIVKR